MLFPTLRHPHPKTSSRKERSGLCGPQTHADTALALYPQHGQNQCPKMLLPRTENTGTLQPHTLQGPPHIHRRMDRMIYVLR